ncbi:MAG TPA: aldo/keto reductase [Solirubrobacteraceae bacterium]|jgi:aryl-alcohol dehydrogenase-like predicted oxidoreductase|nr:aldo/keto reductase [Solirubrobacteraceae bacterium]
MTTQLLTRPLGELEVTVVGLGCNNFGRRLDADGTRAVVDSALQTGINFFDTADIYGGAGESERLLGLALQGRRDQVVLATKWGMDMSAATPGYPDAAPGSREYIQFAVRQSLGRLGVDHIDLYQYHRPDGVTPIDETLRTLHELVTDGIVGAIGASNFSAAQLQEAAEVAEREGLTPFVSVQNQYSLLEREIEREVTPTCLRLGLGILPFFPLASGLLTGKYRRGEEPPPGTRLHGRGQVADARTFDEIEALERFAQERGLSTVAAAIGGLAAQPAVTSVIAGATKPEQVRANAAAAAWVPSPEDIAELNAIFPGPSGV